MCGLVGIAGDLTPKHRAAFKDLLIFDTVRGLDSTGLATVPCTDKVQDSTIFKAAVPGPSFIRDNKFEKSLQLSDQAWIGHNRAATVGGINPFNAHPFTTTNLVGAHNGTIPYSAQKKIKDYQSYGTDSEALLNHICQEGPDKVLSKIHGAWALVWYDFDKQRMFFIRNDERPLSYVMSEDNKSLIWASEIDMAFAAAYRNGIQLKDEYVDFEEDTLYEFNPFATNSVNLTAPRPVQTIKPAKAPVTTYYSGNNYTSFTTSSTTSSTGRGATEATSCDWCTADIPKGKGHRLVTPYMGSTGEPAILCDDCHDDPQVMQWLNH